MSGEQFRDAIAAAVHLPGISEANETWAQADAVLAMPEMVWLREWAADTQAHLDPTCPPALREWLGGPA